MRPLPPDVQLREVAGDDHAGRRATLAVQHAVEPDDPIDPAELEHVRARVAWAVDVLATQGGEPVAWGAANVRIHRPRSRVGRGRLYVVPAARGRGIGGAALAALSRAAGPRGVEQLLFDVYEDDAPSRAFLERRGYQVVERDQASELVIAASDVRSVAPPPGLRITSLDAEPDLRRGIFDVAAEAEPDVPGSEPVVVDDYEHWCAAELDAPAVRAGAVLAGVANGRVVAYAIVSVAAIQPTVGWHQMTGTARDWRGRGAASAVKRAIVVWARAHGIERLRTENEERNAPMLAINQRLGYRPMTAKLGLRGPLVGA